MSTPLEIRRVEPIGQPMGDAFVLAYQRNRLILMTVLSLAFAVVGLILVIVGDGGERIGGALAVLFFGGGAVALGTMVAQPGHDRVHAAMVWRGRRAGRARSCRGAR